MLSVNYQKQTALIVDKLNCEQKVGYYKNKLDSLTKLIIKNKAITADNTEITADNDQIRVN
jgi:hypothetical protein